MGSFRPRNGLSPQCSQEASMQLPLSAWAESLSTQKLDTQTRLRKVSGYLDKASHGHCLQPPLQNSSGVEYRRDASSQQEGAHRATMPRRLLHTQSSGLNHVSGQPHSSHVQRNEAPSHIPHLLSPPRKHQPQRQHPAPAVNQGAPRGQHPASSSWDSRGAARGVSAHTHTLTWLVPIDPETLGTHAGALALQEYLEGPRDCGESGKCGASLSSSCPPPGVPFEHSRSRSALGLGWLPMPAVSNSAMQEGNSRHGRDSSGPERRGGESSRGKGSGGIWGRDVDGLRRSSSEDVKAIFDSEQNDSVQSANIARRGRQDGGCFTDLQDQAYHCSLQHPLASEANNPPSSLKSAQQLPTTSTPPGAFLLDARARAGGTPTWHPPHGTPSEGRVWCTTSALAVERPTWVQRLPRGRSMCTCQGPHSLCSCSNRGAGDDHDQCGLSTATHHVVQKHPGSSKAGARNVVSTCHVRGVPRGSGSGEMEPVDWLQSRSWAPAYGVVSPRRALRAEVAGGRRLSLNLPRSPFYHGHTELCERPFGYQASEYETALAFHTPERTSSSFDASGIPLQGFQDLEASCRQLDEASIRISQIDLSHAEEGDGDCMDAAALLYGMELEEYSTDSITPLSNMTTVSTRSSETGKVSPPPSDKELPCINAHVQASADLGVSKSAKKRNMKTMTHFVQNLKAKCSDLFLK